MTTLLSEPPHVHAESAVANTNAWLLGHSLGLHTEQSEPPAGFSPDERESYREGFIAAQASRRLVIGPVIADRPPTDEEVARYLADRHGEDHDAQFDPNDLEYWTISENEYREVSEGFVRYPHEIEAERVLGHRAFVFADDASAAQEGRAA